VEKIEMDLGEREWGDLIGLVWLRIRTILNSRDLINTVMILLVS
jgi:hypothetical protein